MVDCTNMNANISIVNITQLIQISEEIKIKTLNLETSQYFQ